MDITIRSLAEQVRIIAIYRPPSSSSKIKCTTNDFVLEFCKLLETVIAKPGHLLILGDFNFHYDNLLSPDRGKLSDLLESMNLVQHVTSPTHEKGHILDLIITRASDNFVQDLLLKNDLMSDHSVLNFCIRITCPPSGRSKIMRRSMVQLDIKEFSDRLAPLNQSLNEINVDNLVKLYYSKAIEALDLLVPEKQKVVSDKPKAPWVTQELRNERKELRRFERKLNKSGLEIDRQIYKTQRSVYNRNADQVKSDYYRNKITDATSKQLFSIVDDLCIGKTTMLGTLPDVPSELLAERFLLFYRKKIEDLRHGLEPDPVIESELCKHKLSKFSKVSIETVHQLIVDSPSNRVALILCLLLYLSSVYLVCYHSLLI